MQRRVRVKICCIASGAELDRAVRAGADAVGLVTGMAVPKGGADEGGVLTDDDLARLARRTPAGVSRFLLTDRTDEDGIVEHVARVGVDVVQVCDHVAPDVLAGVRSRCAARVVAVVHMGASDPLSYAASIADVADALLLDSGSPGGTFESRGGTGRVHDWETSAEVVRRSPLPVWLAGGLRADNVATAIEQVRPFGVDLCSGVRGTEGLDEDLARAFVSAVEEGSRG